MLLFLAAGLIFLGYAVMQMLTPQSEWITVEAGTGGGASSASEFEFFYRLGGGEASPTAERRALSALYTELSRNAFEVFHNQLALEGVNNLYAINRHPNEELTVDGALYEAFAAVERSGNRALY